MAKKEPRFIEVPIDEIELNPDNPRNITPRELRKLVSKIKADPNFLLQRSPLINYITAEKRKLLYAGEQRLKAAKEAGHKTIHVWMEDDLEQEVMDRRMIQDNNHDGEWDKDKLMKWGSEFLLDSGFKIDDINFMFNDVLEIRDDNFDVEKAIAEIKAPITKPGDLILLGPHRLLCGDSTKEESYSILFEDKKANVIYDDPPYNIGYDYTKGQAETKRYTDTAVKDDKSKDEYAAFMRNILTNALKFTHPDAHVFNWCDEAWIHIFQNLYNELGITNRRVCLWIKNSFTPVPQMAFNKMIEPCVYGTIGKPALNKEVKNLTEVLNKEVNTPNSFDDLLSIVQMWLVPRDHQNNYEHPTQKPITLHEKPFRRCTNVGDIIFDAFGGSGSTLIAAEQMKRVAYLIEQQPVFCDVIVKRYEALTGEKVTRIVSKTTESVPQTA